MQPPNPYQPGNFAPLPPQRPGRNPWRWYRRQRRFPQIAIGCGVVLFALLACGTCSGVLANAGRANQTSISTPTTPPTRTSQPTSAPVATQKPTRSAPTATATTPQKGDPTHARLGGTLADFIARYGPLNSHSNPSHGIYNFSLYGNDKNDLSITFLYNKHTDGIIYGAPEPQLWTYTQAKDACFALLPSDAQYQRKMTVTRFNDEQLVYFVPSLASLFPASAFTDENGNPAKAGTVGLILSHWTDTTYVQCTLQAGLESL